MDAEISICRQFGIPLNQDMLEDENWDDVFGSGWTTQYDTQLSELSDALFSNTFPEISEPRDVFFEHFLKGEYKTKDYQKLEAITQALKNIKKEKLKAKMAKDEIEWRARGEKRRVAARALYAKRKKAGSE